MRALRLRRSYSSLNASECGRSQLAPPLATDHRWKRQAPPAGCVGTLCLLLVVAMSTLIPSTSATAQKSQAPRLNGLCWSPEALQSTPNEALIHKKVSEAYVIPPDLKLTPFIVEPKASRMSIRGVILPQGAPKLVAITFDLCELPDEITGYDGKIVDFLRENGIKATFFAGGKWLLTHRDRASQLIADPLF
jgi:peptidoglycan-N-acetylglucosamine deacetylase